MTGRLPRHAGSAQRQAAPASRRDAEHPGARPYRAGRPDPKEGHEHHQHRQRAPEVRLVPLSEIRLADGANPRRRFDEQALNELAASIGQHGVLQPLVVSTARTAATR